MKLSDILAIINTAILIGLFSFILATRKQETGQFSTENEKLIARIDSNMKVINSALKQTDSLLAAERSLRETEEAGIKKSNNFVNLIPHLSDDTLSIYYTRSYSRLLNMYRSGNLRPSE
jgi:hypothetical protein